MTPTGAAEPTRPESSGDLQLDVRSCSLTFNAGEHNEVEALTDVSLAVPPGQHAVIVGSNGAGKSSLLNLVCGRHLPDRGTIRLQGDDVTLLPEHRRAKRIGRVFQDPLAGTAGPMTIEENLALAERRSQRRRLRRGATASRDRYREQLARLGMGLEDRLHTEVAGLSGGQRQALALLMAAMGEPELLVLDEHTAALDPVAAGRVLSITDDLVRHDRLTTLMITHNMSHAVDFGDRTVMMHRGRILFDVAGEERRSLSADDLVERFRTVGAALSDRTALS